METKSVEILQSLVIEALKEKGYDFSSQNMDDETLVTIRDTVDATVYVLKDLAEIKQKLTEKQTKIQSIVALMSKL